MAYNFLPLNRDQMYLMPPSLREWLPEKDLAWFVIDAVSQMDLKKRNRSGQPDYEDAVGLRPGL